MGRIYLPLKENKSTFLPNFRSLENRKAKFQNGMDFFFKYFLIFLKYLIKNRRKSFSVEGTG